MVFKSLIIDDDPFIHSLLQDKLDHHVPDVEIVGTAFSGKEGSQMIEELQPDLIFLDVEMSDMTGFEMLSKLDAIPFQTIFITSYNHYAIKAIRFNALDYILKPIDLGELKAAITRLKKKYQNPEHQTFTRQVQNNLKATSPSEETLILHPQDQELRLPVKDIIQVQGERNYSYIHLVGDRKKLVSKTLGDVEGLLAGKGFFRCHKSHLVNGLHIQDHPYKMLIRLSDSTEIPISRRKSDAFNTWFEAGCQ